ncbi:MAG TPA: hypothetical protein VK524_22095 [Polyangiaceae bacterium]|nr:hypothetical protein [Polyangiaceae bacterium]
MRIRNAPSRFHALQLFLALVCGVNVAWAQPNADMPPAAAREPASEPRNPDHQEIEAALAADEKTAAEAGATPAPQKPAPAGGGSLNPDLSFIADFAAAYFSDDEHLQTGAHDPSETGFNLQQLELAVGSSVDPYFRFDANLVFALSGVEIEEAYGTTLNLPLGLQARAGQFLTRFGRLNSTHPHAWNFVDQPFALGRIFGGEGNRGLGIEVSWLTPLPWYVEVVVSSTRADGEGTMRSFFGADDLGVESFDDLLYVTAIKQFFPLSEDLSFLFGVSGAFGPNASGRDNRTDVYGTDLYLKYKPITTASFNVVSLQSEWFYRRRQLPGELLHDVSGYAEVFWRFAQRWGTAARYEYGSPALDSSGAVFVGDPLDSEWTESRHRISSNLTFWPSEFSRLRLQGSRDMPGFRSGIWAAFLALELVTGAHGAHAF